jgi:hypothetical protein
MYVCMHVCTYVCMYVCTHLCMYTRTPPHARHCCSARNISARSIHLAALRTLRSLPHNCYIQYNTITVSTSPTACLLTHLTLQFSLIQYSGFQSVAKCWHLLQLCPGLPDSSMYKRHFSYVHRRTAVADRSAVNVLQFNTYRQSCSLQPAVYIDYKLPPLLIVA